jgi:hypothetical protein
MDKNAAPKWWRWQWQGLLNAFLHQLHGTAREKEAPTEEVRNHCLCSLM